MKCGAWPCESEDIAVTKRTTEGAIGVCIAHIGVSKEDLAESRAKGRKIALARNRRERVAVAEYLAQPSA